MGLTILEGSTFCICDEIGDLDGQTSGLFAEDTRFLSRLELRINGDRPLLLSSGKVEYFSAAFYLRNPLVGRAPAGHALDRARALRRRGDAGHLIAPQRGRRAALASSSSSRSAPTSRTSSRSRSTTSRSATRCDARPLPPPAGVRVDAATNQLVLEENGARVARATQVILLAARRARRRHRPLPARARARARRWELRDRHRPLAQRRGVAPRRASSGASARSVAHVRDSLAAWQLQRAAAARRTATSSRTRSRSRSPTSPRCGCAADSGRRASCPRPGCRGS